MSSDLTATAPAASAEHYVIVRSSATAAARRYVRAIEQRLDGGVIAVAYGSAGDARSFADHGAVERITARLQRHPVFGLQYHQIAPLPSAAAGDLERMRRRR